MNDENLDHVKTLKTTLDETDLHGILVWILSYAHIFTKKWVFRLIQEKSIGGHLITLVIVSASDKVIYPFFVF